MHSAHGMLYITLKNIGPWHHLVSEAGTKGWVHEPIKIENKGFTAI